MTILNPSFFVSKLKVFQAGHEAFSCVFHKGVNVIRGRNSSGKTTVMDLLAFSLGAENISLKPTALLCSFTMVEVLLNNNLACFKREISSESMRPLSIFWGSMDKALNSSPSQWQTYPFKRSEKSLSFSQVILNALDMPLAQGEGASILTMHQILRVLYADQPSLHSPIFRNDNFDRALTRETIGDYLCGIFDDKLYSSLIRLKQVDAELSTKIVELKSIFKVLGRSGQSQHVSFIDDKIKELREKKEKINGELISLKESNNSSVNDKNADKTKTNNLRKNLNKAKEEEVKNIDSIHMLEMEIADSEMFINELESRLRSLNESSIARDYFSNVKFQFCPSCLSELNISSENECSLCKNHAPEGSDAPQLLRMKNEISIQLKESRDLLEHNYVKLRELKSQSPALKQKVRDLIREYEEVSKVWENAYEIEFETLTKALGRVEEEIKQACELQKLSDVISALQKDRDSLQSEKERLSSLIESLESKEEYRKKDISKTIENIMKRLLKKDLPLQTEFIDPRKVNFSFADNTVYVNGSKYFSESSAVVLRHLFHLALLTASIEKKYMRLPRFLMLDGIDDGGMEKERSHNLQKIIVQETQSYQYDFQIIYATSEINPEYENTDLIVGRYFNPDDKSLKINYTALDKDLLN